MLSQNPKRLLFDVIVIAWSAAWIVLALEVADKVRGLSELSGTVTEVGFAIESAGGTLGELASVPLVGDRVSQPSGEIKAAGRSAVQSGRSSREDIRDLSTLLGVAVAIIPTVPLLFIYLPLRLGYVRVVAARGEN